MQAAERPAANRPLPCPTPSGIASGAQATSAGVGGGGADAGASLQAALMAALARQQHARLAGATGPSLADVLRPDAVAPLLADPEARGARLHAG